MRAQLPGSKPLLTYLIPEELMAVYLRSSGKEFRTIFFGKVGLCFFIKVVAGDLRVPGFLALAIRLEWLCYSEREAILS